MAEEQQQDNNPIEGSGLDETTKQWEKELASESGEEELPTDEDNQLTQDESEEELFDPLSGYNSVMTEFNDGFYVNVLEPVSRGYRFVIPEAALRGVNRFFHNLFFPIRFVNNVLQLKLKNSCPPLRNILDSL